MLNTPQLPPANDLPRMRTWLEKKFSAYEEYDELWEMFRSVIAGSSCGTAEFGGPVWLLDFSLNNLQKLFPDSSLLKVMQEKYAEGFDKFGMPKTLAQRKFSDWFSLRADAFIKWQGLGNILLKCEPKEASGEGVLSFYGYGVFLDILKNLVGGKLRLYGTYLMELCDFTAREMKIVAEKNFYTHLDGRFVPSCPDGLYGAPYSQESPVYAKYGNLEHFRGEKGYAVSATAPEQFITLAVNDLMEYQASGHNICTDGSAVPCPYPQMQYPSYVDLRKGYNRHFNPTHSFFLWQCLGRKNEKIALKLPQIDSRYGEFWHRQFPLKQNR